MGNEAKDYVVVTRPRGPHRFFSLIIAGYCLILSLLLILAVYDHTQFERLINGNLPDFEVEMETKLLNAMEDRWQAFQVSVLAYFFLSLLRHFRTKKFKSISLVIFRPILVQCQL